MSDAHATAKTAPPETEESRQPFLGHLRDLRGCVRNAVLAIVIGAGISYAYSSELYELLLMPLRHSWTQKGISDIKMYSDSLPQPFFVYLQISIYAGLFLASPVIFAQLWRFIAPGLYARERRLLIPFGVMSGLLFACGGLFCYFAVFPAVFGFFATYQTEQLQYLLNIEKYLDFATKMLVGFGVAFEVPLILFLLGVMGVITHRHLLKFNRYFVVVAFILSGVLTPPEVYSQTLMAVPMILLYNLSIVAVWLVTKRREAREAAINAGNAPPDESSAPPTT